MSLQNRIFWTIGLVTAAIIFASCGSSKFNKKPELHQQFIEKSRTSQGITVSLDTVFYKGEHYCIMKSEGFSIASLYTFFTLTGEKAIYVAPYSAKGDATTHHEYSFFGTMDGSKAYDDFSFSTMGVIETIINNNLMSPTSLRPIDVGNFCKANPRPAKFNPAAYKITRNMALEVKINQGYGEIYQGKPLIGKFSQGTDNTFGKPGTKAIFTVNFVNGTKCATVRFLNDRKEREQNRAMEIFTEYDGKMHFLNIDPNKTEWDADAFKQAVVFLVHKGYL